MAFLKYKRPVISESMLGSIYIPKLFLKFKNIINQNYYQRMKGKFVTVKLMPMTESKCFSNNFSQKNFVKGSLAKFYPTKLYSVFFVNFNHKKTNDYHTDVLIPNYWY